MRLGKDCVESYLPYELNIHELKENMDKGERQRTAVSVYGRVPMMVSANCVAATMERCRKKRSGRNGKRRLFHVDGQIRQSISGIFKL